MLLSKLFEGISTSYFKDCEIKNVRTDSRRVEPGDLFIALPGEHASGDDFVLDALRRGAAAIVSEKRYSISCSVAVNDVQSAAAKILSNFYGEPSKGMEFFAVTGTNGKTSTSYALARILEAAGYRTGLLGTVSFMIGGEMIDKDEFFGDTSSMTTPVAEDFYRAISKMRDSSCTAAVVELSSHALAAHRADGLSIDVGIFTNLSHEHLDSHGNMERYFAAKATIANLSARLVTNLDDEYGKRLFDMTEGALGVSAAGHEAYAAAENIVFRGGIEYDLSLGGEKVRIKSPSRGMFSVYNTLSAAAAAHLAGVRSETIADALADFHGAPGRMESVTSSPDLPEFIIDYAHTPDALAKAARAARDEAPRRLIILFGCGGDRDKTKRAPMGREAARLADYVIVTGDNPRGEEPGGIISDIVSGIGSDNYRIIPDRREAIRYAVETSSPGDIVLCLGKGHEKYIIDKCGKHFFDEHAEILGAIREKYGKTD